MLGLLQSGVCVHTISWTRIPLTHQLELASTTSARGLGDAYRCLSGILTCQDCPFITLAHDMMNPPICRSFRDEAPCQ